MKNDELRVMLLMKRADIELSIANLYITEGRYHPEAHGSHADTASEYLDDAEQIINDMKQQSL